MRSCQLVIAVIGVIAAAPGAMAESPTEIGATVFANACAVCHRPGTPTTALLQEKHKGSVSALLQERTDLKPEDIRSVVRRWGSRMPAFRPTEVTDEELDALAAYLARNGRPSAPQAPRS